jgi:sugar (pentulose or hexulose) kinase
VAGGGAQSGFWRQLIADALNMPVERACGDSLLGAARMASGAEPDNVSNAAVATPNPERAALLAERFKQWAAAQKTR